MRPPFAIALLIVFVVVSACAHVPQRTAWIGGVRAEDAKQIERLVHTRTSATILSFDRQDDGTIGILLLRSDGLSELWVARRTGQRWKLYSRDCMDAEL